MERKYTHLSFIERLRIETLCKARHKVNDIARIIGRSKATISREIRRGLVEQLDSELRLKLVYKADYAQKKYEEHLRAKGPQLKIGNDRKYANRIERLILYKGYSPEAALSLANKKEHINEISVPTLYSYIDKGIFGRLTNSDLPIKGKARTLKPKPRQKRESAGTSIELRPKDVLLRKEFGHWEMDTVIGALGKTKSVLLVLTERKTRKELIFKMPNKESISVVDCLDKLECKWSKWFTKVFKSITVDNGREFSLVDKLEGSVRDRNTKRVPLYYCHAYCSSERGTNENNNRFIRRKLPKGYDFDSITEENVREIEEWMNTYPRRMFNFKTSEELFEEEIRQIIAG